MTFETFMTLLNLSLSFLFVICTVSSVLFIALANARVSVRSWEGGFAGKASFLSLPGLIPPSAPSEKTRKLP